MNDAKTQAKQYFKDSIVKNDINSEEALELIQKAIDLDPEVSIYWSAKAQYQEILGKYNDALISVDQAIKLNPSCFIAWGRKGIIKQRMSEYKQAADAYKESLKIKPDFNVYTLLSDVQIEFDPEAAIQSAKKALELNPDWDEAKNLLKEAEDKVKK